MLGMIRALLFGLVGLFLFATLFSLLIPSTIRVSRSVVINDASVDSVLVRVAPLSRWTSWHPYFTSDSVKVDFSEAVDSTVVGLTVGGNRNRLKLMSRTDTLLMLQLETPDDKPIDIALGIHLVPDSKMVQVDWDATHRLRWYPWEKFAGIFLDKLAGPGYESALQHLKASVEHMPVSSLPAMQVR